jgi:diguanylate cyclase (GGDEF)-like protein
MSGAAFILIITLFIAGLFCAAFTAIAFYDRRYVSARWFALAYACGMGYAAAEFVLPYFTNVRLGVFVGHVAFLITLTLVNFGLARRYGVKAPITLITATFAVSLVCSLLIQELARGSFLRLFLYQAPYFAMQMIGAWIVMKTTDRRLVDNLLAVFLAVSSLHYLSKPFVALALGGTGASSADYLNTTYAMISQSMGTVLVVATAILLLASLASEIIRDINLRSETDILSGLLNRRGFERRLDEIVREYSRTHLPVSLVMCDLDHFKAVNDTYGHGAGDRLIALFAMTLRHGAEPHHVLARVGGEEFAAILPGNNQAAARLFAENARAAFVAGRPSDLPAGLIVTASFGVAEMEVGEPAAVAVNRADAALYEAKRAGRDCVRASPLRHVTSDRSASR